MWLSLGGFANKKVAWYEYHESRAGKYVKDLLDGYSGYLQTDGYIGYDAAVKGNNKIIHVGCFAHARRKFFEASKAGKKPQSAEEGIKHIRRLYDLEYKIRSENLSLEAFVRKRKAGAGPILEQFKSWLLKRAG
jgi:transposase